ncbi:hypothetical protein DL770_003513 [Monosporascus sp. CRB-9-2]|nr:hypothetical protein DL770_003513 [Monosporascus sp. CRB-9-2]
MDATEVTPEHPSSKSSQPRGASSQDGDEDDNSGSKKTTVRKRTKTGCLNPLGAFANAPYGPIHYPPPSPQTLVREQQLSAAQQKSSSQSLQIIAPKPPSIGYHPLGATQFTHAYPGQTGPVVSPPLNYEPYLYGPPQPVQSRYTFFPPETVDGFSQNQWKQEPPINFTQFPSNSQGDRHHVIPHKLSQQPGGSQQEKGKARADAEQPLSSQPQFEDFGYPIYDDDASMADSDDELVPVMQGSHLGLDEVGLIVSRRLDQPSNFFETQARTFSFFAADNFLATYEPSPTSSPLNDKQIASVFWHFINVTGPSISLYERHPVDPSPLFQGRPVPKSRQHIWTCRPGRRAQPANLAATLLLAFYEVWNSDHEKWSKHLLGARWILREIPLAEMTRSIMAMKTEERQRRAQAGLFESEAGFADPNDQEEDPAALHRDWDEVDVDLLRAITGKDLTYDEFGMLPEEFSMFPRSKKKLTAKDIETYERLSDLFWWYAKMDVYQSILGGTRLFVRREHRWGDLMPSRLTNFSSRDLSRKRRAVKMNGQGQSGMPPGMFAGMMPASEKVPMPAGFSPPRETSPRSNDPDEMDLEILTAEAHKEWNGLVQAFEHFRTYFGLEFQPLDEDVHPAKGTPFGPAAHYRTYSIAGIWMNYYMGYIMLHRAHPDMPPVAMMAAGLAAPMTAPYAREIGRIAAGLEENISCLDVVSTLMGAALIESAFCLFVAGVQYRQDAERHWLIRRLHDIARLTGWQSARQIADGCESAWRKAAALGRGPPYERAPDLNTDPLVSVWGNPRRIDRRIQEVEEEGGKLVLAKEEKAHYAMGLLSVEHDLEKLDLESSEKEQ